MKRSHSVLEQQLYAKLLVEPEVCFVFHKKDGSVRTARGTANLAYIPLDKHPKRQHPLPITTSIRFFDLDKIDWRSFEIGSLICIK